MLCFNRVYPISRPSLTNFLSLKSVGMEDAQDQWFFDSIKRLVHLLEFLCTEEQISTEKPSPHDMRVLIDNLTSISFHKKLGLLF